MAPHQILYGHFVRDGREGAVSRWEEIWDLVTCGGWKFRKESCKTPSMIIRYHQCDFISFFTFYSSYIFLYLLMLLSPVLIHVFPCLFVSIDFWPFLSVSTRALGMEAGQRLSRAPHRPSCAKLPADAHCNLRVLGPAGKQRPLLPK